MWFNRIQVIRSAEDGQQDGVRHEVEAWELMPLSVQVSCQRLEAHFQLLVDMP